MLLCPLQGIVFKGREERKGRLSPQKAALARGPADAGIAAEAGTDLARAVSLIRPASLIGAAARGGAFSRDVIQAIVQVKLLPCLPQKFHCIFTSLHTTVDVQQMRCRWVPGRCTGLK